MQKRLIVQEKTLMNLLYFQLPTVNHILPVSQKMCTEKLQGHTPIIFNWIFAFDDAPITYHGVDEWSMRQARVKTTVVGDINALEYPMRF